MGSEAVPPEDVFPIDHVFEWLAKDPCFATLTFLALAYELTDSDEREKLIEGVKEHESACRSCYYNVRRISATATDSAQRFAYGMIHERFSVAWVRQGGLYEVTEEPTGRRYYLRFASDLDVPFHSLEILQPRNRREKGKVTFKVSDERQLENPGQLLQYLDLIATSDAKTYSSETGELHWRSIFSENDWSIWVRFEGQEKPKMIAPGYTLHSRYSELIRKESQPTSQRDLPDETLKARELALKYDEAKGARFSGFAKTYLNQRKKDAVLSIGQRNTCA